MAYCTQADLELRLPVLELAELTNDTANATAPNATIITALIEKADAYINGKIGQVYTTPLSPVPVQIKSLSVDLACFYIIQRRWSQVKMPDDWNLVYKNACQTIDDISNLLIKLDGSPTVSSEEADIVAPDVIVDFTDTTSEWSMF